MDGNNNNTNTYNNNTDTGNHKHQYKRGGDSFMKVPYHSLLVVSWSMMTTTTTSSSSMINIFWHVFLYWKHYYLPYPSLLPISSPLPLSSTPLYGHYIFHSFKQHPWYIYIYIYIYTCKVHFLNYYETMYSNYYCRLVVLLLWLFVENKGFI